MSVIKGVLSLYDNLIIDDRSSVVIAGVQKLTPPPKQSTDPLLGANYRKCGGETLLSFTCLEASALPELQQTSSESMPVANKRRPDHLKIGGWYRTANPHMIRD